MKIKSIIAFLSLLITLSLSFCLPQPTSAIETAKPELYFPIAKPAVVQFGEQPEGAPLVLSVRVKIGANQISQVKINLSELREAEYYDPISDSREKASIVTPMFRVYRVGDKYAYKVEGKYKQALTHKSIKGIAVATNQWQVELPNVGQTQKNFELKVTATNRFNQSSSITIPLQVVNDTVPPEILAQINYRFGTSAARPGDEILIKAKVSDELTGVASVRLGDEARGILGREVNLTLTRKGIGVWQVKGKIARDLPPGTYPIHLFASDRAGNEAVTTIKIAVVKQINTFQIKLSKGWNLISVPKRLAKSAVKEIFADLPIEKVLTYVAGGWLEPEEIEPGPGYLIKANKECKLELKFQDYDPSIVPLTIKLNQGWNLIGYVSPTLEPMMPLTFYLGEDLKGKWIVVYNEDGEQARPQSRSPYVWATDGFPTLTNEPFSANPSRNLPRVELGKGYWIYLDKEGVLVP